MQVILIHDVPKVGREGEVVTVAGGYARNYLIPRKLAVIASGPNMKTLKARQDVVNKRIEAVREGAGGIAAKLEGKSVTIQGKAASNSTKLFGAVTALHVADAIKDQLKVEIDRRRIVLPDPIKTIGEFDVPIHLHQDVDCTVKVIVYTDTPPSAKSEVVPEAAPVTVATEATVDA